MTFDKNFEAGSYKKLIGRKSIPAIFSMLLISLSSLVESFFTSKLGSTPLFIVFITSPINNMFVAVFLGLSSTTANIISRNLGSNKSQNTGALFFNNIILGTIAWFIFMITLLPMTIIIIQMFAKNNIDVSQIYTYVIIMFLSKILTMFNISF